MARAIVVILCLVVAVSLAENQNTIANVNLAIVDDLDEYLMQHPEVKLLQKLDKVVAPKSESPLISITYRLGKRIAGKWSPLTELRNIIFSNEISIQVIVSWVLIRASNHGVHHKMLN